MKRDSTMLEHEDAFMTKQTDMIDRLDKSLKEISDKNTQLMDQLADVSSKYEIISVQYKTINEQNKKIMTENQELRMQVGLLNDLVKRLNTDLLAMGGHDYSDKIEEISST
ncbi:hypothetical protein [Convivina praedatoris]|uniref:hypothetical protein n=1 Tax=Convivina praedatoris TaxID=2880963 RepID=UPI001057C615|nr:hypothetical protein [Convivina sp. LMG 32447]